MAIMITDECINCGACEPECPNTAIYEGGMEWTWAGGTSLKEIELEDGSMEDANIVQTPVSDEFYYIVSGKCTECTGFHEEPIIRKKLWFFAGIRVTPIPITDTRKSNFFHNPEKKFDFRFSGINR